ncbi:MAG: bifunctional adenosylcobinamide kinase/adenosylcobinamide-phosphate guanylyltransferase [Pseudoruegeria sp.]
MLPQLTLVIGGASSGKSLWAERLILAQNIAPFYIATAQSFDSEMDNKIRAHKVQRGDGWTTIETPFDAASKLADIPNAHPVLFDCATLWLTNHLVADHDLPTQEDALLVALSDCKGPVVIVSNEVGAGIVPENPLSRRFRDAQGKLNQRLATEADLVVTIIAGLPLVLKGSLP